MITEGFKAEAFGKLEKTIRNDLIKKIKEETKISNRQLAKLTGIGRNVIDKV